MSARSRLAAFGVALVAVLGAGVALGAAVGPDPATTRAEAPTDADQCPPTTSMEHGAP